MVQTSQFCFVLVVGTLLLVAGPGFSRANIISSSSDESSTVPRSSLTDLGRKKGFVEELAYEIFKTAMPVCEDVTRNELGFRVRPVQRGQGEAVDTGVWKISRVFPGSSADQAGLKKGTLIAVVPPEIKSVMPNNGMKQEQPEKLKIKLVKSGQVEFISSEKACGIHIRVIEADRINIKIDGSEMGITTGLLEKFNSKKSLKSLIAHQTAHLVLEHPFERQRNELIGNMADLGSLALGVPTLGAFAYAGSSFDREDEEMYADRLALAILGKSGELSTKAVDIWKEMKKSHTNDFYGRDYFQSNFVMDYFITDHVLDDHPLSEKRLNHLKEWAGKIREKHDRRASLHLKEYFPGNTGQSPNPAEEPMKFAEETTDSSAREPNQTVVDSSIQESLQPEFRQTQITAENISNSPQETPQQPMEADQIGLLAVDRELPDTMALNDSPGKKFVKREKRTISSVLDHRVNYFRFERQKLKPRSIGSPDTFQNNQSLDSVPSKDLFATPFLPEQSFQISSGTSVKQKEIDQYVSVFDTKLPAPDQSVSMAMKIDTKLKTRRDTVAKVAMKVEMETSPAEAKNNSEITKGIDEKTLEDEIDGADSQAQKNSSGTDNIKQISRDHNEWYTIQLISLTRKEKALQFARQIPVPDHRIQIRTHEKTNGLTFYRVRLGTLETRQEAEQYARRLAKNGTIDDGYWISKVYR